jgi:hypothetical protein
MHTTPQASDDKRILLIALWANSSPGLGRPCISLASKDSRTVSQPDVNRKLFHAININFAHIS